MNDIKISKSTGHGTCVAGGIIGTLGTILSPLTFGIAIPLVIAGLSISLAGSATTIGTEHIGTLVERKNKSKI